jgi:hypothetical protein
MQGTFSHHSTSNVCPVTDPALRDFVLRLAHEVIALVEETPAAK